jgi:neutral trehalase
LETLQGEIEMTYRYYAGFGAKKDLTTTEMLNHILRTVPNYKPTTEEHDLEDMKRICDHYVKALEEITKKNRKAETCRMIALKALGELNDDNYQPELLIEENLKLKIQVEDLESKIVKYSIDKVFPTVKIYEN